MQISDTSNVFNTARIDSLELKNLIEVAKATIESAHAREESRGAHCRSDFEDRNDEQWLKHTLFYSQTNSIGYRPVNLKPLTVETFPLKKGVLIMKFSVYRFDPEFDKKPYMKKYEVDLDDGDQMLLDALMKIKQQDETLALRKSCREGVCGSDGMNINGKNGLACVTKLKDLKEPVVIRPMPGLPVIKDLIVDMDQFLKTIMM